VSGTATCSVPIWKEEAAVKRKMAIVVCLFTTFGAMTMISFFGLATPVHSNPIVVEEPTPTPTPSPETVSEYLTEARWGILIAGYILTLAVELIFIEWFTRGYRDPDKPAWALRWLVVGANTLTFPITQILAVIIGLSLGWNAVILAELFPLVAEYIVYQWQIPRLHKSGLFASIPSSLQLVLMTVCANVLSFGAGLLLMRLI
jgi:hypothetical protein